MSATDMNSRTVGGLIAYCDWLGKNGYQGAGAVKAWKVAINKVFSRVAPDDYEAISIEGVDVDDYMSRFRTLAISEYRSESIDVYGQRVRRALDAYAYFLEHGKAPSFKKGTPKPKPENGTAKRKTATPKPEEQEKPVLAPVDNLIAFPFPMEQGRKMAEFRIPAKWSAEDHRRACTFLQTFVYEEQRQLPSGSEAEAA